MAIQWWTPSFGAGLPAFFNPLHTQFMLAQWLTPWLGPWGAAIAQPALFNAFGSSMVVWVCARRLRYALGPSMLAGLTFATCGFMWGHTLHGHITYNAFPLVAIVLEALHRSISTLRSVIWLSLSVAVIVYGGGDAVIIIFGLNCLILMFFLPWWRPEDYVFSDVVRRLVFGAVGGSGIVAAKVTAVFLFLQSFPRLADYSYEGNAFLALPRQIFGLRIFLGFTRWLQSVGTELQPWNTHIEDSGYGLVTLGILAGGAVCLWRARRHSVWSGSSWPLAAATVGAIWITTEFTLGRGLIWPLLKSLPFLRSMHENYRFAAAFSLPVALCVAPSWSAVIAGRRPMWTSLATVAAAIGTLASVDPYLRINPLNSWFSNYDITPNRVVWEKLRAAPDERFTITHVLDVRDDATFLVHASSWKPYEPIFGYGYGGPEFRLAFPAGPVERISEEPVAWRFHDPRRFILPGLASADRFAPWTDATEAELKRFLARHQPDWPIPWTMRAGMTVTLGTLLILFACVVGSAFGKRQHKRPDTSSLPCDTS